MTSESVANLVDITSNVLRYRECARHVYNSYFNDLDLGSAFFEPVNDGLFIGIALCEANANVVKSEEGFYPQIAVKYEIPPPGLQVMHEVKEGPSRTNWPTIRFHRDDGTLAYVGFFDFCNDGEQRDLRYVRARALDVPEHPTVNGRDVLIATEFAKFFLLREKN